MFRLLEAANVGPPFARRKRAGLANIRAGLEQITGLIGIAPTITSFTPTDRLVLITFDALGSPCQIRDGSDTCVVEKGLIVTQTVHDRLSVPCDSAAAWRPARWGR